MPEYQFNYQRAKPNRFATPDRDTVVVLDEDVDLAIATPESANEDETA